MGLKKSKIILLTLATGLMFTPLSIVSFLIFIYILSDIQPVRDRTKLQSYIWSYTFISIFIAILYMLAWLVKVNLPVTGLMIILAGFSWLIVSLNLKLNDSSKPIKNANLMTVGAAFLAALFVSMPLFLFSFSSSTVLRYAAHTGDDINHLAIIEADRKTEGYLYSSNPSIYANIIQPSSTSYPQGWHMNGAVIESLIIKLVGHDNVAIRLSSYLFYKTLWLFICVYLICDLLATMLSLIKTNISKYVSIFIPATGLVLAVTLVVPLFGYGFQTFIAETAFLCAAVIVTVEYAKTTSLLNKNIYLVALGLLVIGATYTWIVSGLSIAVLILIVLAKESQADIKYLTRWPVWLGLAMLGCAGLTLTQIYIMLSFGSSSGSKYLASSGLAPPISIIGVVVLLVITLLSLNVYLKRYRSWLFPVLIAVSGEFLLGVYYQQLNYGDQRYYIIKLAYSTSVIVIAFLMPIILVRLRSLKLHKLASYFIALLILFMLPFTLRLDFRKSAYPLKNSATIKAGTANYLLSFSGNDTDLVVHANNQEESYLATKLLSSVSATNSPSTQKLLDQMNSQL